MKEIEISANNFSDAVSKLEQGIEEVQDELGRDGVISVLSLRLSYSGRL